MYDYLRGILTKITAKSIVVELGGIGYSIQVSNPYSFSQSMNQELTVYVYQVIRDDAHLLYGFQTEEQKSVFLMLISVSGIGPTSALAILASDDTSGLVTAIEGGDITYLTKFPKIGKKTAQQMVLDLQGKLNQEIHVQSVTDRTTSDENHALEEAIEALEALGFKASELKKIRKFFVGTQETAEDYIKKSLRMLTGR